MGRPETAALTRVLVGFGRQIGSEVEDEGPRAALTNELVPEAMDGDD
jgi:hypothetical protein